MRHFFILGALSATLLIAAGCSDDDDNAVCGNGAIEGTELCDTDQIGTETCATQGFSGGTLSCNSTCDDYDTSQCTSSGCGNGALDTGEDCDATNLDSADCTTIPGGFTGGTLACANDCTFDTASCTGGTSCGDGNIDAGELCDDTNLDGNDCTDVGNFVGGTLACANDCTFDTTSCTPPLDCGNGALDTGEDCDATNLDGADCTTVAGGFTDGTLACANDCTFDTTNCTINDGIADALASADGTPLSLPIEMAYVTYLKPELGSDATGFFVQAQVMGPALYVAIDPATLTPVPAVGDQVSFTITELDTNSGMRSVQAITGFAVDSSGFNVSTLVQDVSSATDLVSNLDDYESELITFDATIIDDFTSAGFPARAADIATAGYPTGDSALRLRIPSELETSLELVNGCNVTVTGTMWRFNNTAQPSAWVAADLTVNSCPAPLVTGASATNATTVVVSFDRNIDAATVAAGDFSFDNGLTATAIVGVTGADVTVTTSAQVGGTSYLVTANTLTDLAGTSVDTNNNTATFVGFLSPAVVMVNELNANITGGCDLVELRVVSGGSMDGFELLERNSSRVTFSGLVVATNDIIVVHFDSGDSNCNPNSATNEVNSPTDQAVGSGHTSNYDSAFDWWTTDSGITASDMVITLLDNAGLVHDALFASDALTGTAAAGTETQAAVVAAAGQWEMVGGGVPGGGFVDDDFNAHAAQDLNGTGTTAAGESIQRGSNTDSNTVADWSQTTSSFGLINAGQTPF